MSQVLILMQGAPGSGKSTVAETLAFNRSKCVICSADAFMMENVFAVFHPDKLQEAHARCFQKAQQYLELGWSVIIDNTNVKRAHAQKYIDVATSRGVPVQVIRCYGQFQNTHGVPEAKVAQMRAEMEELL